MRVQKKIPRSKKERALIFRETGGALGSRNTKEDNKVWNGCQRKNKYRSEAVALKHIQTIYDRFPETNELFTYQCNLCGSWHLTKIPRRG